MKLSTLLFDFLADDVFFELASIWRRKDGNVMCSDEENILIKECLITLASVGLNSRNEEVPNNLHEKSTPEILNANFNMVTEKARNLLSYNGIHPMEYSTWTKIQQRSITKSANEIINKNIIKINESYDACDGETFEPTYGLVYDITNDAIKLKEDSTMRSYAGYKLLEHRKNKYAHSKCMNFVECFNVEECVWKHTRAMKDAHMRPKNRNTIKFEEKTKST